jgi:hypothetical protein
MLKKTFDDKTAIWKALVEDCKHSDHPSTDCTVGKTEKVSKIVTKG